MIQVIQIVILGLALGGVYALTSSGMTLIFGVMRIVNLAHSAFIVMAAYLAFWLFKTINLDPPLYGGHNTMPVHAFSGNGLLSGSFWFPWADNPLASSDITVLTTFATGLAHDERILSFIFTGIYRIDNPGLC